jgi:hypothetical protein
MNIPNTFKTAIKDNFYDKTIDMYDVTTEPDTEGNLKKGADVTKTGSFKGNISFEGFDAVQEEYGIDTEIDAMITTDEDIDLDQVLAYGGVFYEVIRAIENDSHNLLITQKCLLRSSISTSV